MTGTVTEDRFAEGDRVGDYRIDRHLADDAVGAVYLATHVVLPRQAHLKIARDGTRVAAVQVLREACILEAIAHPGHPGHPGIPRVYECGVLADRRPWSALERISGVGFDRFVGEGALAVTEVVIAIREVADILRHIHDRGVVHGALTARTILRTQRRRSAYALDDWSHARTLDASTDATVDPRDDVYALGAIAFRALTGVPATPAAAARSAEVLCPAAPVELVAVVDQMLAEPVLRPTAGDVFDRAVWLCETLQVAPLLERPRWTPPQGFVGEAAPAPNTDEDRSGFAVRISRTRSS